MKTARKWLHKEAVMEFADYLMGWGFNPKEAFKTSEGFWKKHKKKLEQVW